MPESPSWLHGKGRRDEALSALVAMHQGDREMAHRSLAELDREAQGTSSSRRGSFGFEEAHERGGGGGGRRGASETGAEGGRRSIRRVDSGDSETSEESVAHDMHENGRAAVRGGADTRNPFAHSGEGEVAYSGERGVGWDEERGQGRDEADASNGSIFNGSTLMPPSTPTSVSMAVTPPSGGGDDASGVRGGDSDSDTETNLDLDGDRGGFNRDPNPFAIVPTSPHSLDSPSVSPLGDGGADSPSSSASAPVLGAGAGVGGAASKGARRQRQRRRRASGETAYSTTSTDVDVNGGE